MGIWLIVTLDSILQYVIWIHLTQIKALAVLLTGHNKLSTSTNFCSTNSYCHRSKTPEDMTYFVKGCTTQQSRFKTASTPVTYDTNFPTTATALESSLNFWSGQHASTIYSCLWRHFYRKKKLNPKMLWLLAPWTTSEWF